MHVPLRRAAAVVRFLLVACAWLASAARAEPVAPPVIWHCWLESQATTLVCSEGGALIEAMFDDPVLQHAVQGEAVPDARAIRQARSVTGALRLQAAVRPVSHTVWRTPLFAPAYDDEFTSQLARAVMCGRQPACQVHFRAAPPPLARYAASDAPYAQAPDVR